MRISAISCYKITNYKNKFSNPIKQQSFKGENDLPEYSWNRVWVKLTPDELKIYDSLKGKKLDLFMFNKMRELQKLHLSSVIEKQIDEGDYKNAITNKLKIAKICHEQKKESDAYKLETTVKELYKKLTNFSDKNEMIKIIRDYNSDMARYINKI